jgi:hypothetical protein
MCQGWRGSRSGSVGPGTAVRWVRRRDPRRPPHPTRGLVGRLLLRSFDYGEFPSRNRGQVVGDSGEGGTDQGIRVAALLVDQNLSAPAMPKGSARILSTSVDGAEGYRCPCCHGQGRGRGIVDGCATSGSEKFDTHLLGRRGRRPRRSRRPKARARRPSTFLLTSEHRTGGRGCGHAEKERKRSGSRWRDALSLRTKEALARRFSGPRARASQAPARPTRTRRPRGVDRRRTASRRSAARPARTTSPPS